MPKTKGLFQTVEQALEAAKDMETRGTPCLVWKVRVWIGPGTGFSTHYEIREDWRKK